jgi:tetratricopeptide (TPR) repeat protein
LPLSTNLKVGIAIAGLFGVVTVAPAADAASTPADCSKTITKKRQKPLAAAQKARDAKSWDEVIAKANEADAMPDPKVDSDTFWIREYRGIANVSLRKYPEALADLVPNYESTCMGADLKADRAKLLMQLAYETKDYPKTIEFGEKSNSANADPTYQAANLGFIADAAYRAKDYAKARSAAEDALVKTKASGKVPDKSIFQIAENACINLKDNDCIINHLEGLLTHYPSPEYWRDLVSLTLNITNGDRELLNLLRLSDGVGAMSEPSYYIEMAQLALLQGLPGEAQSIIEKGQQQGVFKAQNQKDQATRLLTEAKQGATLDKSTLDKQDASARAKPAGEADVKLGAAYLSYGEPQKAIEALQRGLAKPGVKSKDEAGLLLGIAFMRTGNKAEAAKAFRTVSDNASLKRIAKYWLISTGEAGKAS